MMHEGRGTRADAEGQGEPLDLISAAADGDVAAFESLYRRYSPRIYGLCLRLTGQREAAEDCTQETFVDAWRALFRFEGRSSFSTWLHSIAVRTVLSRRRGLRVKFEVPEPAVGMPEQTDPGGGAPPLDLERAIAALPEAARHVLVLDGPAGDWLAPGLEVIAQRRVGFAERLAGAFEDVGEAAFLIGMDTPQVTPAMLDSALQALQSPANDAVLGLCEDGGYWGIGLCRADRRVFAGVPMSTPRTGECQRLRLEELGLRSCALPVLRDVDCHADAMAVAAEAPDGRFARALARIERHADPTQAAA